MRAAAIDHLKKVIVATGAHGPAGHEHVLRRGRLQARRRQLGGGAAGLAGHRALRPGPGRQDHLRELPHDLQHDEWPGGHNIAYSPYIWRRILEAWGDTVGLNFDPSHLVWLMIDQARFIREFGPHILHFQAKDVMIDRDGLYERGTLSGGIGWQVPRIPGLGRRAVGGDLLGALPQRLRWPHHHRARGPGLRGQRREGQAWLPRRA